MKYTQLKAQLKEKLEKCYLIFGEDRFLCFDALKKIEDAANILVRDMNSDTISGEKVTAKDIVASANLYPFGDEKRLVVVKNYNPNKNKEEAAVLQEYLNNPLESTVLVFFNPDSAEFLKPMSNITPVDCGKIDAKFIYAFIKNKLVKNDIEFDDEAVEKLIIYSNSDMAKIDNELEKLVAYLSGGKKLTKEIVEEFVVWDKEFQIFQLAEFLARGDAKSAVDLVDSFCFKPGSAFTVIAPLANNYRRALFVALNKEKSAAELATMLGTKEYAIRQFANQIKVFSPKKLKKIVSMIAGFDEKIKIGEMKENIAINSLIFNILNLRGQNE